MAPDENAKKLAYLAKLFEALRENQAQGYEIVEEIRKALAGEKTLQQTVNQLRAEWLTTWRSRYAGTYAWGGMDNKLLTGILRMKIPPEDIAARMRRFIQDNDPFYVSKSHPFGLFRNAINRYAPEVSSFALDGGGASGCSHQPPCTSDYEHTQRGKRERQAVG